MLCFLKHILHHGSILLDAVFFMSIIMYTNNNALHVKDAPKLEHFHFIISFVFFLIGKSK